jgi:hypothetical protein
MPKKKNRLTPEEQRQRFEEEVEGRRKAGELDPGEADAIVDRLVRKSIKDHGP